MVNRSERLLVLEYLQKEGINYIKTFSPIEKMTSIHILSSLVAIDNVKSHQIDVKMTFLNGDLQEEIYIDQAKSFSFKTKKKKLCEFF